MRGALLVAIAIGALCAGCGGGDEPAAAPDAVQAIDFGFQPADVTIGAGTTVTWTNTGETIHTVKGPGFFSKAIDSGASYEHRFDAPGTYRYICTLHPTTMRGTITVAG